MEWRYERKFLISGVSKQQVEKSVIKNTFIFSKEYNPRRVNNIYFDSVNLKNYHSNVDGLNERIKIRIRWYGKKDGEIASPILELKIKNNSLGRKELFPLKKIYIETGNISNKYFQDIFRQSELPNAIIEKLKFYKAQLFNSYNREYYISSDKRFRITVDEKMEYNGFSRVNNNFNKYKNISDIILELKYGADDDDLASRVSSNLPYRLTKNSKYVSGIEKIFNI